MKFVLKNDLIALKYFSILFLSLPLHRSYVSYANNSPLPHENPNTTTDITSFADSPYAPQEHPAGFKGLPQSNDLVHHQINNQTQSLTSLNSSQNIDDDMRERVAPDYLLRGEWWPEALNLPRIWGVSTGNGVTIAICDSGLHVENADIGPNVLIDKAKDVSNPYDRDNVENGRYTGQGTATAGIVAGVKDFRGINGIAYNSRIIPIQIAHYDNNLDLYSLDVSVSLCISYASTLPEVAVILVQATSPDGTIERFELPRYSIQRAIEMGKVVVIPAGDTTKSLDFEKEKPTGSIIVGGLSRNLKAAIFSNYGEAVTVSAFGEQVKTSWGRYGETRFFGGTASAAAQLTGIIALMKEINPFLTPKEVKTLLEGSRLLRDDNRRVGGFIDTLDLIRKTAAYRN